MHETENEQQAIYLPSPLYCMAMVLFSYLTGRLVTLIIPCPANYDETGWTILTGAVLLAILNHLSIVFNKVSYRFTDKLIQKKVASIVPQTISEFQLIGIKSPIDFCYTMMMTNYYLPKQQVEGEKMAYQYLHDEDLYRKELGLFKTLFGRNPAKCGIGGWVYTTVCETAMKTGMDVKSITYDTIYANVSEQVRNCFDSINEEWTNLVRSDIAAGDSRI